jgi:hypothetical protein
MGMALAPFRAFGPAAVDPDAVGDDSREDEDHPDDDDEVSRVLGEGKPGGDDVIGVGDEAMLRQVEEEPEGDHREADLRRSGQGARGGFEIDLAHARLHLFR